MRNTIYIIALFLCVSLTLKAASLQCANAKVQQIGIHDGNAIHCLMTKGWLHSASGCIGDYFNFPQRGVYRIRLRTNKSFDKGVYPLVGVLVDNFLKVTGNVNSGKRFYEFNVEIPAGIHKITFTSIWPVKTSKDALKLRDMAVEFNKKGKLNAHPIANLVLKDYFRSIEITAKTPKQGKVTLSTHQKWVEDCRRREKLALELSKKGIERYRKGACTITVRNVQGEPVENAQVSLKQIDQDFLFGANIYAFTNFKDPKQSKRHRELFADIFNLATTWLYWKSYEAKEGHPRYWETENVYNWADPLGIKVKGHPVLWDFPINPAWVKTTVPTLAQQKKRVCGLLTRFRGKVAMWDIVNEPGHGIAGLKVDMPYKWARKCDPKATLVINDNAVLANGFEPFYNVIAKALKRKVPIDAIGLQAHVPARGRLPLDQIQFYLDKYAKFGLKLHITELEVPSDGSPIRQSAFGGKWTEQAQRDYLLDFYRICFGHPAIAVIGYWDFAEGTAFMKGGGLVRKDLTVRPAYKGLKKLIHEEFKTKLIGRTDSNGKFSFRGFGGNYHVVISLPDGRRIYRAFHLAEQQDANVQIDVK